MGKLVRLDAELVRRGLARSRQHAAELIEAGHVRLDGVHVSKASRQVATHAALLVEAPVDDYVSRGGHKLAGALDQLADLAPRVHGRVALDAGASTGGFTDVLLRRGAARVIAVDVGYGQLAWSLRQDERVTVLERTNVRTLDPDVLPVRPELVVGDLSFISLRLVLPALTAAARPDTDFLLMVKPQFEVGKEQLGRGGVVRDPGLRAAAIRSVIDAALGLGLDVHAVVPSPLPGPSGNVEYFVGLRHDHPHALPLSEIDPVIDRAIRHGPGGDA